MINLSNLQSIFYHWVESLLRVWDVINSPLHVLVDSIPSLSPTHIALGTTVSLLGIQDLTLLEFMLGAGIILYIVYQLVVWLLNLIT